MTHENTIATLIRLRECALKDAADVQQIHAEYVEYAEQKASEVLAELAQAGDYSRLLRELDPEHADQYPDPEQPAPVGEPEIATGLRQLADLIASLPELAPRLSRTIQYSALEATAEERIRKVEELAALVGAEPEWVGMHYKAVLRLPEVEFLIVTTDSYSAARSAAVPPPWLPEPEPFVKASPAEVAQAYASSAEYNRTLMVPEDDEETARAEDLAERYADSWDNEQHAADDARSVVAS